MLMEMKAYLFISHPGVACLPHGNLCLQNPMTLVKDAAYEMSSMMAA